MTYRIQALSISLIFKVIPTASLWNVILPTRRHAGVVIVVIASPFVRLLVSSRCILKRLNAEFQRQRHKTVQFAKDLYEIPIGSSPTGVPNAGGVFKIRFFDRSRSLRLRPTVKILRPSATVVRVHNGVLAEKDAVSSTTLAIVALWWSQLRSSWHQEGWSYESLLMTPTFTYVGPYMTRSIACWLCGSWAY